MNKHFLMEFFWQNKMLTYLLLQHWQSNTTLDWERKANVLLLQTWHSKSFLYVSYFNRYFMEDNRKVTVVIELKLASVSGIISIWNKLETFSPLTKADYRHMLGGKKNLWMHAIERKELYWAHSCIMWLIMCIKSVFCFNTASPLFGYIIVSWSSKYICLSKIFYITMYVCFWVNDTREHDIYVLIHQNKGRINGKKYVWFQLLWQK